MSGAMAITNFWILSYFIDIQAKHDPQDAHLALVAILNANKIVALSSGFPAWSKTEPLRLD